MGVMGGHAVSRDTEPYAGAARLGHRLAAAGLAVLTGGGPGAMEAANLGALAPDATRPRRRAGPARRRPVVRPRHRTVGRGRARRARRPAADAGGRPAGAQHRHPHVVLRPRAAQRVLQRHRQVLLERAAGGRPARALHLRARRPRGCGGHGAGGLPGRHPALLRRPGVGAARSSCSSASTTGPTPCRCGPRCARWPTAGPWRSGCTSSRPWTTPPSWSPRHGDERARAADVGAGG